MNALFNCAVDFKLFSIVYFVRNEHVAHMLCVRLSIIERWTTYGEQNTVLLTKVFKIQIKKWQQSPFYCDCCHFFIFDLSVFFRKHF